MQPLRVARKRGTSHACLRSRLLALSDLGAGKRCGWLGGPSSGFRVLSFLRIGNACRNYSTYLLEKAIQSADTKQLATYSCLRSTFATLCLWRLSALIKPPRRIRECIRNGKKTRKEQEERLGEMEEKEIAISKKELYAPCDVKRCTERGIRTDRLRSDDDK